MAQTYQSSSAMLRGASLLLTESKAEFDRIRDALNEEIKPRGVLEQMYVEDVAYLSRGKYCDCGAVKQPS